ncbi:MAG TPA: hypothetical protein VD905_20230, partial [Flavobacteriales bacterium]|nr:hypothetical protein [Flavobacteriales bacterium]
NNNARANQVELIKGLFYTVQVGVYSKPVSLDKIFGIQPLNSELTRNNKIRYTTGIYAKKDPANARKDEARNAGIKDAFVTAYFNGKKITIAEAEALVAKYGETIYADPKNLSNNNANVAVNNNPPGNLNPENNPSANNDDKGFYTVILGEYPGEVPNKDAEVFLTGNDGYKILKTNLDGKNIYFVETNKGKNEAVKIQNTFKNKGLTKTSMTTDKLEIKSAPVVNTPPNNNPNNNTPANTPPVNADDKGFYTVILGEYAGEVPNKDAEVFLTGNEGYKVQKTYLNNKYVYFIETEKGKNEAVKLETTFKGKGLTNVRSTTQKLDIKSAPVVNTPPANNPPGNDPPNNTPPNNTPPNNTPPAAGFYTVVLGEYAGEVPNKDAEIYLNNNNRYKILKTKQNNKSVYFIETE